MVYRNEDGKLSGGWPIGYVDYEVQQPSTLTERTALAQRFVHEFDWPIPTVMDGIDNAFDELYGIWPDRALCFRHGTVVYKAQLGPNGFRNADQFTRPLLVHIDAAERERAGVHDVHGDDDGDGDDEVA